MSLAQLNYTTAVATLLARFSFRLAEDVSAPTTLNKQRHNIAGGVIHYIQIRDALRTKPCDKTLRHGACDKVASWI